MSKFDPYDHLQLSLNPDGTLNRFVQMPKVLATSGTAVGEAVVYKDITLSSEKKTWVRIYRPSKLPSNDNAIARLPILIYFHGGGWIIVNADDTIVHTLCTRHASDLPAIIVSLDYRLAPEARLPAQYEDAMDAIQWVKHQAVDPEGEKWLKDYGDFSRLYLFGSGNGANMVFHTAIRALDVDLTPVKIAGLVMSQPMFSGKSRTKSELKYAADQFLPLPAIDLMWELALPPGIDKDHRYCNPMAEAVYHPEKIASLGRCLVIGFGGDLMIDKQQEFVQMLVKSGVQVDARFDDLGFHGIDLVDPRRANVMLNMIKDFI